MGRRMKEIRAGEPVTPKTPTPVEERSHTWRRRWNPERGRHEFKPSKTGRARYGIRDLGWARPSTYLTVAGKIREEARVNL